MSTRIRGMPCKKCGKRVYESGFCKEHFMEYFERKVRYTIRKFELFKNNAKIAVAVSGGKDSTVLLYLLHKFGYDVEGLTVNAFIGNYTKINVENLKSVCGKYDIPLKEISLKEEFGHSLCYIRDILKENGLPLQSCAICGVLRRYLLNKYSKGFDCIATGHTMDDEAQTFLMNIFRNAPNQAYRGGPKSEGKGFVKRVKPLYLLKEKETAAYSKAMKFPVNYERCPCSVDAYRRNFRDFLEEFEKKHPNAKDNIITFYLSEYGDKQPTGEAKRCNKCGEPSSGTVCKACQIINRLKAY